MRIRTGLGVLACCCATLSACTAAASSGPDTTVTTPAVGTPQPPASVQAALSGEAFTPYAALGQSDNDGLAPGESDYAMSRKCISDAGYPGGQPPLGIHLDAAGLAFGQPWGQWGYLGIAEAQQYGFQVPPGSALTALGIDVPESPGSGNPGNLPPAEQAAFGKCATITEHFSDTTGNGPLAGIQRLGNDIYNDVRQDTAVQRATRAWSACLAKNGYTYSDPQTVFFQEIRNMYGGQRSINSSDPISAAASRAQLAMATSDADCTQSADLAGIYFAVQASYEQQITDANQQALTAAVRQYRAAYARELGKLPALLSTAKVTPARRRASSAQPSG